MDGFASRNKLGGLHILVILETDVIISQVSPDMFLLQELEITFLALEALSLLDVLVSLEVLEVGAGAAPVVSLVAVETEGLQTVRTLQLVCPVMADLEVLQQVSVNGGPVAADLALVRHLGLDVEPGHVLDQLVFGGETVATDLTDKLLASLEMLQLHVRVDLLLAVKVFVAESALGKVRHVDGRVSLCLHVEVKMFQELQIVHKNFLADVTLERLKFK